MISGAEVRTFGRRKDQIVAAALLGDSIHPQSRSSIHPLTIRTFFLALRVGDAVVMVVELVKASYVAVLIGHLLLFHVQSSVT